MDGARVKRSLVLATDVWTPAIELARLADAAGLHRVWTTEYATRDAVVRAVALGMSTSRIQVGSGIGYAFTRLPLAAAAMAADARLATGGRFTLGLGAGTRGMRRHFYGHDDFDHPAPRLAEYVALLRAAWAADGTLEFTGDYYSASVPGFHAHPELAPLGTPPVYGSGLNSTMIRYAAASCDGVALHPVASATHYLERTVAPAMARGREQADREVALAAWRITSVDDDGDQARERVRANLAFYFSTPSYASVVEGTRWATVAEKVRERFGDLGPAWSLVGQVVPDDMVEAFSLSGTPIEVAARLPLLEAELAEQGADELVCQTVGIGLSDEETVENCRRIIAVAAT